MSVINEKVFCDVILDEGHPDRGRLVRQITEVIELDSYEYDYGPASYPVNREAALALLEQVKQLTMARGYFGGKYLRPYNFDSFLYLDRTQPWWGFEFETGWVGRYARSDAINAAWDIGQNGVTFDGEGEGSYECEITFSPSTMSDVVDGTAPATRFVQYMHDHPDAVYNSGASGVGTHLNISLPEYVLPVPTIADILNNSIALLPIRADMDGKDVETRLELFGRANLYAGFCSRVPHDAHPWLEGKLFRTTYSMDQFQKYIRSGQALTRIMQAITAEHTKHTGVSNLLEMVKDPSVEPVFKTHPNLCGSSWNSWVNGICRNPGSFSIMGVLWNVEAGNWFD